jgi:hypothetical protein
MKFDDPSPAASTPDVTGALSGVKLEPFVVKHYAETERPIIKGNGFDGLQVGEDREEVQQFVDWLNARLLPRQRDDLELVADAIEALAFQMPPPNEFTPLFVGLAIQIRRQAHRRWVERKATEAADFYPRRVNG